MNSPFILPFIRWANVAILTHAGAVSLRRIYDHELVYVLAGRGRIAIAGREYPALSGHLFLIQPRDWHSFAPDKNENLHLLGVHFDWKPQRDSLAFPIFSPADEPVEESKFRKPRAIENWDLSARAFIELGAKTEIRRALENVVSEYSRSEETARESAGALLAHAIFLIARFAASEDATGSTPVGADALRRLNRARAMLEEVGENKSIEEIAFGVGWSGDHLRRVMREAWQTSPTQIQMNARMARARELLRDDARAIAEIGRACGFDDASHFARVFKAHTGLTPRQYWRLARRL